MKVVSLRDAKASLSSYLETAQRERVLITTHGKPTALVIGVRGRDLEAVISGSDAGLWKLIEERRREKATVSLNEVEARLGLAAPKKAPVRKRRASRRQTGRRPKSGTQAR